MRYGVKRVGGLSPCLSIQSFADISTLEEHRKKVSGAFIAVVVTICVLPFLLNQMFGFDFGTHPEILGTGEYGSGGIDAAHHMLAGSFVHTILEWSAFCTAILTAALAFIHFRIRGDVTTPIIGMALFYAGCMDAFHTLAADRLIEAVADNTNLIPFTWAICRLFNALILIGGIGIFLVSGAQAGRRGGGTVLFVSAGFGAVAYATIRLSAASETLPQTMFPDALITRPWDVAPLILYLFAGLYLFPRFYRRSPNIFTHALIISMIPQVMTQLHMAFGSSALFDNNFNIAHTLKIVAYVVPFSGLVLDYVETYRGEALTVARLEEEIRARKNVEKEIREARDLAESASRAKSEFLASMSHELRTPMNSIIGFTRRLLNRLHDTISSRDLDALETVDRNAKHLLELINDVLDLSRIEAGQMGLRLSEFNGIEVIREAADEASSLAEAKALQIDLELPQEAVTIEADRTKFRQILTNLFSNAIKYTKQGKITVSAVSLIDGQLGPAFRVAVRDTGEGISPEDQKLLFGRFTRLDTEATRREGGTGLGLTLSAQYARMHGGRIDVTSEPGKGSEFSLVLPLQAIEPKEEATLERSGVARSSDHHGDGPCEKGRRGSNF